MFTKLSDWRKRELGNREGRIIRFLEPRDLLANDRPGSLEPKSIFDLKWLNHFMYDGHHINRYALLVTT